MSNKEEIDRLDSFVKEAPGNEYTIDQKEQELCRQNLNGQGECIKLNLECKGNAMTIYMIYLSCHK